MCKYRQSYVCTAQVKYSELGALCRVKELRPQGQQFLITFKHKACELIQLTAAKGIKSSLNFLTVPEETAGVMCLASWNRFSVQLYQKSKRVFL